MNVKIYLAFLILFMTGCASHAPNEGTSNNLSYISESLKERTDYSLRQDKESDQFEFPEWVTLNDGLSQDEAIALALWNNAQFQTDLAALGFARADLLEANMLSNPVFSILFPVNHESFDTALGLPIEVLWQRPHRIAAAKLDAQKLSENLIENGLGLVRDVQITFTELLLAQKHITLASAEAQLQLQINQLNQSRLRAGDVSQLDVVDSYVDSLRTTDAIKRLSKEADVLKQKLNRLLGIPSDDLVFDIVPLEISPMPTESVEEMLKTAFICRPDLRATELAIEAAGKRIGWEKSKVYNFITIIEVEDEGEENLTVEPGFEVEIPIFNQNQGQIARAKAQLQQATRQYQALRQDIVLQVRQAYTRYISAYEQFDLWNSEIIPSLQNKVEQTSKSFEIGQVSYLTVLEAKQKLIEAKVQLAESTASLLRNAAELNYSIGKKMI